jgi:hypothetical protein
MKGVQSRPALAAGISVGAAAGVGRPGYRCFGWKPDTHSPVLKSQPSDPQARRTFQGYGCAPGRIPVIEVRNAMRG